MPEHDYAIAGLELPPGQAPSRTVELHDGSSFSCRADETILRAGLRAGFAMPYECASGSCGSCKCRLLEGEVDLLWNEAAGLSPRDRAKGDRILACQARPVSNIRLNLKPQQGLAEPVPERFGVRVVNMESLCRSVVRLTVKANQATAFLPGQFYILESEDGLTRRAYSCANLPNDSDELEFLIKEKPGGTFTGDLGGTLQPGVELAAEGPYGRGYLRIDTGRPVVAIAGGSGLAPMLSIMRALSNIAPDHPASLYFGVNTARDLFCIDELRELADRSGNCSIHIAIGDEHVQLDGFCSSKGMVGDIMLAHEPELGAKDLYLAGPSPMVNDVLARTIRENRINADQVFFDRFD